MPHIVCSNSITHLTQLKMKTKLALVLLWKQVAPWLWPYYAFSLAICSAMATTNVEEQQLAAAQAKAKALEAQKEHDIYENFATPLAGTFLNLPHESVVLKCPSCGIKDQSVLENDLKWWASELNRIVGCLFVTFCCCCCMNYIVPCKQTDRSHYCGNCGCYFGRAMKRRPPLKIKTGVSQ